MPSRKQSERDLKGMMNSLNFWSRKSPDRRFPSCPVCHRQLTQCPYCRGSMLFKKAETLPDFLVAKDPIYIECKQGNESWSVTDFTEVQIDVMNNHARVGGRAWLFLTIGTGRVPNGRGAWFVEWGEWLPIQEDLIKNGYKSLRFESTARSRVPTADEILSGWALEWDDGRFIPPVGHSFWIEEAEYAERYLEAVRQYC